jgi:hypothetical protein
VAACPKGTRGIAMNRRQLRIVPCSGRAIGDTYTHTRETYTAFCDCTSCQQIKSLKKLLALYETAPPIISLSLNHRLLAKTVTAAWAQGACLVGSSQSCMTSDVLLELSIGIKRSCSCAARRLACRLYTLRQLQYRETGRYQGLCCFSTTSACSNTY